MVGLMEALDPLVMEASIAAEQTSTFLQAVGRVLATFPNMQLPKGMTIDRPPSGMASRRHNYNPHRLGQVAQSPHLHRLLQGGSQAPECQHQEQGLQPWLTLAPAAGCQSQGAHHCHLHGRSSPHGCLCQVLRMGHGCTQKACQPVQKGCRGFHQRSQEN